MNFWSNSSLEPEIYIGYRRSVGMGSTMGCNSIGLVVREKSFTKSYTIFAHTYYSKEKRQEEWQMKFQQLDPDIFQPQRYAGLLYIGTLQPLNGVKHGSRSAKNYDAMLKRLQGECATIYQEFLASAADPRDSTDGSYEWLEYTLEEMNRKQYIVLHHSAKKCIATGLAYSTDFSHRKDGEITICNTDGKEFVLPGL
ncbi:hypothetical protein C8Q75DRAFT_803089 [Abortiporus biennis]|nr:hypothetical protein C8Q75DRAFT_803089 [Abortiporus biennis]